ncbi:MAG: hypothetical protein Q9163_004283, partial [Psora crenata]
GHHLWNGAIVLSRYLEQHPSLVCGKHVLELGAGAGLPGIVAGMLGAARVLLTDYPDAELIENLQWNIAKCRSPKGGGNAVAGAGARSGVHEEEGWWCWCWPGGATPPNDDVLLAKGYCWGADVEPLLQCFDGGGPSSSSAVRGSGSGPAPRKRFDTLLLADLVFNHSCHEALVRSVAMVMAPDQGARALVFFTPYRPWLLEQDLRFFTLCEVAGFSVRKVLEEKMETVMFVGDPGDEDLRRTVFGYEMRWRDGG